jgi:hypothetical protein
MGFFGWVILAAAIYAAFTAPVILIALIALGFAAVFVNAVLERM